MITPPIPPVADRPVCVLVSWLADNPHAASKLEYLDCAAYESEWRPAVEAVDMIQPEWPVEVRLAVQP